MAPTPPLGDSPGSVTDTGHQQYQQSPHDKIRRNVACISCRDSKVRCRANSVAGQPCQRCAKLQLSCIYDRTHKRITKRSKLELLEQELKSIKEAVNPRNNGESSWSPPTPHVNGNAFPEQASRIGSTATTLPALTPGDISIAHSQTQPSPVKYQRLGPSSSRVLNDKIIPGEDIDWYFEKYLQSFHPYLPVLRKKNPDECYQACPTLFWLVIYVSCRRYSRDEHVFTSLVDQLERNVGSLISAPVMDLEAIHAILLMCAWPLPTIRFVADPSVTSISAALTGCLLLGLHTGRGSHPRFCIGGRQNISCTDREASITWIFCCILAQRISTNGGCPPPFLQHNDAQCKKVVKDTLAPELMALFDFQKFLNRLHMAMAAQIAAHGGVTEGTVKTWEDDFEALTPFVTSVDTDCARFMLLLARLEVQNYYFASPPDASRPNFHFNALRVYNTSHALLTTALALESNSKFLSHGPHWVYRTVIDASSVLISTLNSTAAPRTITPADADAIALQIRTAAHSCSVRENDLPSRGAAIIEAFWSIRNVVPKSLEPAGAWPERLGAAVTYWCLTRFRDALQEAKKSTEGVNKGLEAFHNPSAPSDARSETAMNAGQDPFQDVDWTMFMDEFGWGGDGAVFLGPP
ncbi:putative C6 transcription factor [Dactylonectria macrodidyma]|uniref:C6 transcription factor n=1 Tax=Dactylonectria macrodidyma TaxID=307937 RepID=A0A9P9ESY7_9HYPO|nr:putative C6 transcription factor [Dactylonectria macrodidyma]